MTPSHSPLHLPASTASGQPLGSVVDVELEIETQLVAYYLIKPHRLVPDMVRAPLRVHREQVVRLTETELIVDDAVLRAPDAQPVAQPS